MWWEGPSGHCRQTLSLEGVCVCIQLTFQLGQLLGQLALQHTSLLLHPSMHSMGLAQPHSPWG